MKKVVIIGGGLAGLTTAYYLSKNPHLEIEIYEAQDTLGGRVQTVEIDGFKFNYGAFMIFPWYKRYDNLLKELQYTHHSEHLDGKHEYAWSEIKGTFHEVNRHYVLDDVPIQKLIKFLPDFLTHKTELYNPDPHRFDMMTVEDYFKKISFDDVESLDIINKVATGYTYGALSQLPMAIYFGFAKEILFNNGFKRVSVLSAGAQEVINILVANLISKNVTIKTSASVSVSKNKAARLKNNNIEYDYLVLASAMENLIEPYLAPLPNPITYNDHYVAYIKTEYKTKVNGRADWNLLYTGSINQDEPQLTCIGNFEADFPEHPEKSLITYLRIPKSLTDVYNTKEAKKKITELVSKFLPDAGKIAITFIHH